MSTSDGASRDAIERRVAQPVQPSDAVTADGRPSWHSLFAAAPLLALAYYLLLAVDVSGVPIGSAVRAVGAIGLTQVLPGVLVWRLVRRGVGTWFEDIAMGAAVGVTLAVGVQVIAGMTHMPLLARMSGPALAVLLLAATRTRTRIWQAPVRALSWVFGPAVAVASLLLLPAALAFYRTVPATWSNGFRSLYVDMPFHLALSGQLAHRGPTEMPYVVGEPLQYHWFSHAWTAQVGLSADVELAHVLFGVLPAVFSVLAVCAVAATAARLARTDWIGPAAAVLVVVLGTIDLTGGSTASLLVSHLSPSLSVSVLPQWALTCLLGMRWRDEAAPVWGTSLVFALAFTAAGTKGSALAVVVPGVVLAACHARLLGLPVRRRIATDAIVVLAALALAILLLFGSGEGRLVLAPLEAMRRSYASATLFDASSWTVVATALGVLVFVFEMTARGAGILAVTMSKPLRRDPVITLLAGIGIAAVLGVGLLTHPGDSQAYFLFSGAPAFAVGSAIGLGPLIGPALDGWRSRLIVSLFGIAAGLIALAVPGVLLSVVTPRTIVYVLAGISVVLLVAVYLLRLLGGAVGRSTLAAVPVVVIALLVIAGAPVLHAIATPSLPAPSTELPSDAGRAFSADQVEAARWLRAHSHVDDVVATNRHCGVQQWARCDSRRFYVAAYTERRVFVEGWAYTRSWANSPEIEVHAAYKPFWDPERLALNDDFLGSPTIAEAKELHDRGVRWLFIDRTAPYSEGLDEFATRRFETEWAVILELGEPA